MCHHYKHTDWQRSTGDDGETDETEQGSDEMTPGFVNEDANADDVEIVTDGGDE